ncbi:hypothetical protein [Saccharothrix obliqua]|uniref:hypothetical protein n=1 Tax=Saccharothrix obliqua TaxID=2861747 RepID=UPI001C5EDF15|nr:hypothetical protein [Saccharothrix obliqua]MBW4719557.1 hypothetical protein [Saccharothrix obliqua]
MGTLGLVVVGALGRVVTVGRGVLGHVVVGQVGVLGRVVVGQAGVLGRVVATGADGAGSANAVMVAPPTSSTPIETTAATAARRVRSALG